MRYRSCASSPKSEVGITLNLDYAYAAGDDDGDEAAAAWVDGFHNRWFLDPIFKGAYPADMVEAWRDVLPEIHDGDLETISAPIDFLGVNNYTSPLVAADTDGSRSRIVRRPTSTAPTWGGRSCRTGCATCSSASRATTRRRAST